MTAPYADPDPHAPLPALPPLNFTVRWQLSAMMFLQFAVWGAWFTNFYNYLTNLAFTDTQAAALCGNMALGAIVSTLFAGAVADRLMDSEKLLGLCHLLGAAVLYFVAQIRTPDQYWELFGLTFLYSLLYNPTLVLANSITFRHVPDGARDFPGVRVFGTLGWIAAGLTVDLLLTRAVLGADGQATTEPAFKSNGILLLAAGLSAALGVASFFLPRTPPTGKKGDAIPIVKALRLLGDPSFAVFFGVSLAITVVLAFYFTITGQYLGSVGIKEVASTMAIGQACELIFLPLLPLFLWRLGMKWVLAVGMLCWGVRYLCFAEAIPSGLPLTLAVIGIALHGFCFDFFFAAGFVHCDNEAPSDIKASAQALFSFLTYGVGMWLGSLLCGISKAHYTTKALDESGKTVESVDWTQFWLNPALGVLACLVVFVLFFRLKPRRRLVGEAAGGGVAGA